MSRGVREGSHLRSAPLVPDLRTGRRRITEGGCSRSQGMDRGAERANRPQGKFQKGWNHENRTKIRNPRLTSERSRQLASSKNKQGKGGRFWWLPMERRQLAGGVGRTSTECYSKCQRFIRRGRRKPWHPDCVAQTLESAKAD